MSSHKILVGIFIVANVILLALALTIGIAAAVGINVPDEYTAIHDAWANAQVEHAPSGPWSFNRTMVAPSSDRWKGHFQIDDFVANFRSMRTAWKPAMSTAVLQQEQPQALGASPAVVGISGDIYNVPSVDYPTIQQAIDNATGGETILVEPGRYNETLVINVSHILLKANSTNPADTIISANGTDDHVITITNQSTNVTIEGFTIQDARGTSQDVAGIFMDNTSECAVSNTVIRNISAAGSVDAYGVMMIGTTIKPRFIDTTIRTILGERNSVGIVMENAHNPSFDPTLIENVTAANGTAFGILMAVTDGWFSDTTISDIAGNSSAYGILMIPAINITFDLTVIERVTASAPNGDAYGVAAYYLINGSFSDTTIRDVAEKNRALGIAMNATSVTFDLTVIERVTAPDGYTYGILMDPVVDGSFVNTTIRDIAGNITARGIGMNAINVTFEQTVIERVNGSNGAAYGIDTWSWFFKNISFIDTTIRDISGYYEAFGIIMSDAENVTFDPTVIERVNAPNGVAWGIYAAIINGSFTDTTIRDVAGKYGAIGIYMAAEDVSFDPTVIERVNASNGVAAGIGVEPYLINGSFTDTTIRDIAGNDSAYGIYMMDAENVHFDPTVIEWVNAPNGAAFGIYAAILNGSFTDTTIRDIVGCDIAAGIYMYAENVRFDPTVIERVTESAPNGWAIGIIAEIINGSFTDTTIRDIVGYDIAAGIYIDAENVRFDPTVIERVNASNGGAAGIYAFIMNGRFTDTTIRDIVGYDIAAGIYMYPAINVSFLTGELTNCGHGLWLEYGDNNRIEGFIIRDNTLFDTGVHLETDTSNTTVCRNCFYNNVLQAWDNGTNNIWIGNYWEPEPGAPDDPYVIPGNARSRDTAPLTYCPLCAVEVPVTTPIGLIALVSLLSAIAAVTITKRKRL
jgi:hypothetical protein